MMALFEAAMELLDSDSDDDFDFDDVCILVACALVRQDANRVPGYEDVVNRYHEYVFKRLLRLSRETFDWLSGRFRF